jgi:hypothetical protein
MKRLDMIVSCPKIWFILGRYNIVSNQAPENDRRAASRMKNFEIKAFQGITVKRVHATPCQTKQSSKNKFP